jgi:hypothetical protein
MAPTPPQMRAAAKARKRSRANERAAFLASRAGEFDRPALDAAMSRVIRRTARAAKKTAAATPAKPAARKRTAAAAETLAPMLFPTGNVKRWVPIGPSVVRKGQAEGRPRVTGRVTDLAVSPDGQRAYAGSAKGGVSYSGDAGATWVPVGGWAARTGPGGDTNAQSVGSLLVSFGATTADDVVLVGTGELLPSATWPGPVVPSAGQYRQGGVGVLAAKGPAAIAVGTNPWDDESGMAALGGLGVFALARDPGTTGAAIGAPGDRVLAATSAGLFLGTRTVVDPTHNAYIWTRVTSLDANMVGTPTYPVTDVKWVSAGAHSRIFVALDSNGVAFSDNLTTFSWVPTLTTPTAAGAIAGRMSLSSPVGVRMYALGEVNPAAGLAPAVWLIPDVTAATPAATQVSNVPSDLWGTQRDYDQAIAVTTAGANDRVYLGGSTKQSSPTSNWDASLWCFDVNPAAAAPALAPAAGVSTTGSPPAGDGAGVAGLVGNNVHADVHVLRLTGLGPTPTQLWVGCDGGVFVSGQSGRVNTFRPRSTGIANLEVGYLAQHPTSSAFLAIGCQDNGTSVRSGDTVWEEIFQGDGGGLVIHPTSPEYIVAEYIRGTWQGVPATGFLDPLHRALGHQFEGTPPDREYQLSEFYSAATAIQLSATASRVALGTNRVWISDDISTASTWRVLPATPGATVAADERPGGTDPLGKQNVGVPAAGTLGGVVALRWVTPSDLLAVYAAGLVRYIEAPAGSWTATVLMPAGPPSAPPIAPPSISTDVAPVPGTSDFYLATTGAAPTPAIDTLYFFDAVANTFVPTGLRHALDSGAVVGPVDPAYAVVVDPAATNEVYVGTVTGVWHGVRSGAFPAYAWAWTPFVNGLPQATVQDLAVWTGPTGVAGAPRLLRAALQSRGVWEVDLAAAQEPQRTYLRVHERDDRRVFPTPMANPRQPVTAPQFGAFRSPDVTVRPANNVRPAPTWQLGGTSTIQGNIGGPTSTTPSYQLWTFQTAFRWFYPSLAADGLWSDQLAELIALHRSIAVLPAGKFIDRALWNLVVGTTRIGLGGVTSTAAADPLAVYREPWQSAMSLDAVATEVDLTELVVPPGEVAGIWNAYREPCVVDVLLHHRDVSPLPPLTAVASLLWRFAPDTASLLATPVATLPGYAASLLTPTPQPLPGGWNVVMPNAGVALSSLPVSLDARMPRAIPIGLDLSAVPANNYVLLLAIAASSVDALSAAPLNAPATVVDLVRNWPYAALRLVHVVPRPA